MSSQTDRTSKKFLQIMGGSILGVTRIKGTHISELIFTSVIAGAMFGAGIPLVAMFLSAVMKSLPQARSVFDIIFGILGGLAIMAFGAILFAVVAIVGGIAGAIAGGLLSGIALIVGTLLRGFFTKPESFTTFLSVTVALTAAICMPAIALNDTNLAMVKTLIQDSAALIVTIIGSGIFGWSVGRATANYLISK